MQYYLLVRADRGIYENLIKASYHDHVKVQDVADMPCYLVFAHLCKTQVLMIIENICCNPSTGYIGDVVCLEESSNT